MAVRIYKDPSAILPIIQEVKLKSRINAYRTKLQKLLCLKYFGKTVEENSVGFQTKNAPPSGLHEIKAEFSLSVSFCIYKKNIL